MAEIAGLKLIVPSSVAGSGVSVSATGKVTFTSATTVSINGCFSATYDNYLIVGRLLCAASNPNFYLRVRASGSDDSGSNYTYQNLEANNTAVSASRTTSTFGRIGGLLSSTLWSGFHLYVYGPSLSQPTAYRGVVAGAASSAYIKDVAGTHSLSSSYDGLSISIDGAAAFDGSLTIYGLSQ